MLTPAPPGRLLLCWMGGFPTTMFPSILLLVASPNTTMPFVLPMAVFPSTRLLLPARIPMPKLMAVPVAYPFPLTSFHRNELLLPRIHMPPHGAVALPFLAATTPSTLIRDAVRPMRSPDRQLVVSVTSSTWPPMLPTKRIPSP